MKVRALIISEADGSSDEIRNSLYTFYRVHSKVISWNYFCQNDVELKDYKIIFIVAPNNNVPLIEIYNQLKLLTDNSLFIAGPKALSTLKELNDFYEHNQFNEFIYLPFNVIHFKKVMEGVVNNLNEEIEKKAEVVIQASNNEFAKLKLRNLYYFKQLPADVFIKVGDHNFSKIISLDEPYSHNIIKKYIATKVRYCFLKKTEYIDYLDNNVNKLTQKLDSNKISAQELLSIMIHATIVIHEHIRTIGVSDALNNLTHKVVDQIENTLWLFPTINKVVANLCPDEPHIPTQSIMCAYICGLMLKESGWYSKMAFEKLALSSLVYDISLEEAEWGKIKDLNDPLFEILEESDKKTFIQHPVESAKIAALFNSFPSDVDEIIMNHHQGVFKKAFPQKVDSSKLSPIIVIFILSTRFITEMMNRDRSKTDIIDAYLTLINTFETAVFKPALRSLSTIVEK